MVEVSGALGKRKEMNVILIGFMGAGKTTCGQLLAREIEGSFVDTDAGIETAAGRTIPEIFAAEGEALFRDRETAVLREVLDGDRQVISTGGGIVLRPENREAIRAGGFCVWLAASPEAVWERVREETHRPLLQTADPEGTIRRMLGEREPLYRETAHLRIDTAGRGPEEIVAEIARSLQTHEPTV
jgi:shikimate kinase